MRAVCWHGKKDAQVDTVPDSQILNRRDAIVRVTATAICGADLHLYGGTLPTVEEGDILGHEFMGESRWTNRPGVSNCGVSDAKTCCEDLTGEKDQRGDRRLILSPLLSH
jgi:hypothetical protein